MSMFTRFAACLCLCSVAGVSPALAAPPHPDSQAPAKATHQKADLKLKDEGVPKVTDTVLTREQYLAQQKVFKEQLEREKIERKAQREAYQQLLTELKPRGITIKRGVGPTEWHVIAPALAKTTGAQRKQQVAALTSDLSKRLASIYKQKPTIKVFADPQEKTPL